MSKYITPSINIIEISIPQVIMGSNYEHICHDYCEKWHICRDREYGKRCIDFKSKW